MVPASYRNSIYTKFSKLLAQALRMEKTILCFLRPLFTRSKWNMSEIRVSNGTGQRNFSGQRDSQNFFVPGQRDNGTEVPLLSRDKGTTGQAQNLAKGRDGPGQPKPGTGRAGTAKIRDGTRDKTGQSRKGCSKTV